jgi:hemoglobin
MELKITYFEAGTRPEVTMPVKDFYSALGEDGVRRLVTDHYALLRKSSISHLFPEDQTAFDLVTKHSADFFIQVLGGPTYYNEKRGKPMLVARHAPFAITPEARVVWLQCYQQLLPKLEIRQELIHSFWNYLNVFSHWMINTESSGEKRVFQVNLKNLQKGSGSQ